MHLWDTVALPQCSKIIVDYCLSKLWKIFIIPKRGTQSENTCKHKHRSVEQVLKCRAPNLLA